MTKKVLLVGLEYTGPEINDVEIETLGLCRPEIDEDRAAYALYEYDLVVINPESYSHFIFGKKGEYSNSDTELGDLKRENNSYDLDSVFDYNDRSEELNAALVGGTRVIWLLAEEKRQSFFGWRNVWVAYLNKEVRKLISGNSVYKKKSRRVSIHKHGEKLEKYFDKVATDGWRLCIDIPPGVQKFMASTPEGYALGVEVKVGGSVGWLLTPPRSPEAVTALIQCGLELDEGDVISHRYEGIFLSHTSEDKPFVRKLKDDLEAHGVKRVWIDEAEIHIGDSLIKKIEEGITKTKYIGAVLSPRSIKSRWVQKELEIAMTREIGSGEVVVLPLVMEDCELPPFLQGKLYADLSIAGQYDDSLQKILRRLRIK
ncbi:toll/interleukin-1 receptor domain-containing protein [Aeromonas hydrophila]|uniref:toll/interleukin-1 receptor domain-containing protein n=1 Tax=Aeromonas hydrophila TaxID=644 RepID=UPI00214D689E|nr:toll/interleukin-1 receptor domain-containing protein [Aeromonas hydrophila]MCR3904706.1 toll/interleukin-1 receptor domain-containing protein [Aeromonas hydrophila]